jgi:CBS domain containing-hemolysin-like protein
VALLVCAFFSSAEIGFIKLQRFRLKHLEEEGVHGADRVARIMEHPEKFLSTVLTGISFAETIVVSLGTIFIVALLGDALGTPIAILLIAIILLIFAKVIPKTIAAQHPERIALLYGRTIELIMLLLSPVVLVLSWVASGINRIFHLSTMPRALISIEEIGTIISIGEEEGVVDEHSAHMLRKVVSLGDCQVNEVMTPRTEAIWLQQGSTLADFFKVYAESPAQRYPIYEETYDNVKGMLSIRDVLTALSQGSIDRKGLVTDLARPVYFVPEGKTVGELFSEMQEEGYFMAVVVDEYGGSSGLVSIDQLIEEIVGEVEEDIIGATKAFKVVGEQAYKIRGSMRIDEVNEQLGLGLPEGDYKTIGGFALNLFGHLPKEGEQIAHDDLRLVVAQVKENKITRLFVTKEVKKLEPDDVMVEEPSEEEKEETDDSSTKGPPTKKKPKGKPKGK